MPAFYSTTLGALLAEDEQRIIGLLITGSGSANLGEHLHTQTRAWQKEITILKATASELVAQIPASKNWGLLLEYPIPRRQKRIDGGRRENNRPTSDNQCLLRTGSLDQHPRETRERQIRCRFALERLAKIRFRLRQTPAFELGDSEVEVGLRVSRIEPDGLGQGALGCVVASGPQQRRSQHQVQPGELRSDRQRPPVAGEGGCEPFILEMKVGDIAECGGEAGRKSEGPTIGAAGTGPVARVQKRKPLQIETLRVVRRHGRLLNQVCHIAR